MTGTPTWLADQISGLYREFHSENPIKLSTPQRIRHDELRLTSPLPTTVNCILQISVEYCDSTERGTPNLESMHRIAKPCHLWTDVFPVQEDEPSLSLEPFEPQATLVSILQDKPETEGSFPGWLAIDFGTSNSTVTLFNPVIVPPQDELPQEQEAHLRKRLAEWVEQPAADALLGIDGYEWERFLSELSKTLEIEPTRHISDLFRSGSPADVLEAIRYIELYPFSNDAIRRVMRKQLNKIYHETFRVPPLRWQSLTPVELDDVRGLTEIPSEIKVIQLHPLTVEMGERIQRERMAAISSAGISSLKSGKGQFFHSPKRYFGQDRPLSVLMNGTETEVAASDLIQSAWKCLIDMTEKSRQRNPNEYAKGRFNTVVVTYPTIAPPGVRLQIEDLLHDLGIQKVQIAYDEAVSVALFFLWREFGGDLSLGIESFKIRCRKPGHWSQNALVIDIGGGTTDIALLNLMLSEKDPFEPGEDRGDGGRYYVLTPKVLGSSGHLQLGGERITLRMFQFLKVAIADKLLSALTQGYLHSDYLENRRDDLMLGNNEYIPGSLLVSIDLPMPIKGALTAALDAAERILPTQWSKDAARWNAFYRLWQHAETAKLSLGNKPSSFFTLSETEIEVLLTDTLGIDYEIKTSGHLNVTLTSEQFERVALPVVQEAVQIAKGLMENRLKKLQEDSPQDEPQKVDWLILSGKTCNLYLVQQEIKRVFSQSDYFVWNSERVTFVPEYSKLATSVGACYAEKLRQLIYDAEKSKRKLRQGANQLFINVQNLFYFLPCSFILRFQGVGDEDVLFTTGQELYQLNNGDTTAKIRSPEWLGIQLTSLVYRKDFDKNEAQLWSTFDSNQLATELGMTEFEYRSRIQAKFEVDSKLTFSLLLCRDRAYRLIDEQHPICDLKPVLQQSTNLTFESIFNAEHQLSCDIAVGVLEAATVHEVGIEDIVFSIEQDYRQTQEIFHCINGLQGERQIKGLISAPLPAFPHNGKHTFCLRLPNTKDWIVIGELAQPDGQVQYNYPWKSYATLDEEGRIQIHIGEVPYWTSTDPNCLKQEGCVYKAELDRHKPDMDDQRDPFSGIH